MGTRRPALVLLLLSISGFLTYSQNPSESRIYANVELVQIPVIAFDDKGAIATNLQPSDFRLFEDGIEQKILYFDRERAPVSFVILADLSSSMTRKIPFVREATLSLLDPDHQPQPYGDEYSIFSIGKKPRQLLSFTRDERDLERRLPLLLTATNESTALFDGVWLAVNVAREQAANQRHAVQGAAEIIQRDVHGGRLQHRNH
jgi:VWFA-related protein